MQINEPVIKQSSYRPGAHVCISGETLRRFLTASLWAVLCTGTTISAQGFGSLQGALEKALTTTGADMNKAIKLVDPSEEDDDENRPPLLPEEELTLTPPQVDPPDVDLTMPEPPPEQRPDPIFDCCQVAPFPQRPVLPNDIKIEVAEDRNLIFKPKPKWPFGVEGGIFF